MINTTNWDKEFFEEVIKAWTDYMIECEDYLVKMYNKSNKAYDYFIHEKNEQLKYCKESLEDLTKQYDTKN